MQEKKSKYVGLVVSEVAGEMLKSIAHGRRTDINDLAELAVHLFWTNSEAGPKAQIAKYNRELQLRTLRASERRKKKQSASKDTPEKQQ